MNNRHNFWIAVLKCDFNLLWVYRFTPGSFNLYNLSTASVSYLCHSATKDAMNTNQGLITWFQKIDQAGFHPCTSGCRYDKGEMIICQKGLLSHRFDLIHDADKFRI